MEKLGVRLTAAMGPMLAPALAEKANVSKQSVYNVVNGTTSADKIRAVTLFSIASALDVFPEWLLYGKDRPAPIPTRPSPAILKAANEFLHGAFNFPGKEFDLANDAELFANAYQWISETNPRDRSTANFSRWLRARERKANTPRKTKTATTPRRAARGQE